MDPTRRGRTVRRGRSLVISGEIRLPTAILPWEIELLPLELAAPRGDGEEHLTSDDDVEKHHAQG